MMNYLSCKSYAKINSCLHVINKRSDGYHNIESIFHSIDLYDKLIFKKNNTNQLRFDSNCSQIDDSSNLITKTFEIMANKYSNVSGLDISLDKLIPIGSGLGGGSSNAAVALIAINKLFNLKLTSSALKNIAIKIGSDVPFFIEGGSSCVKGRGEIIEKIPYKKKYFILIFSELSISTREIYEALSENSFMKELDCSELISSYFNSFENSVMDKYPELMQTKYWLSTFGRVRMSGTGSTLYIEFDKYENALDADREIGQRYNSIVVSSLESYEIFS